MTPVLLSNDNGSSLKKYCQDFSLNYLSMEKLSSCGQSKKLFVFHLFKVSIFFVTGIEPRPVSRMSTIRLTRHNP